MTESKIDANNGSLNFKNAETTNDAQKDYLYKHSPLEQAIYLSDWLSKSQPSELVMYLIKDVIKQGLDKTNQQIFEENLKWMVLTVGKRDKQWESLKKQVDNSDFILSKASRNEMGLIQSRIGLQKKIMETLSGNEFILEGGSWDALIDLIKRKLGELINQNKDVAKIGLDSFKIMKEWMSQESAKQDQEEWVGIMFEMFEQQIKSSRLK